MNDNPNTLTRVRFAPSPTGALHIGGVRTALYNYLYAKKNNGKFILRIEDTDQTRFVEGAEKYIIEALKWVGIEPDESPSLGGNFAPYRQSERKKIYKKYVQQLLDSGDAYYAFDTSEELDVMRARLKVAKVASPQYNVITRMQMKNSLTLPADEVKEKIDAGHPFVVRFKIPRKEEIRFHDKVRGWVMVHSSTIDDKVIMKSDGMPTYHLSNVVDDYLMKITDVIRGEEWLPSAPLHILLYRALGWESIMPSFAHLPLLLKPDGNGKLSKRDGDKLGFPVFPIAGIFPNSDGKKEQINGFKESGYLPEAFLNFLAFLGWNPGTSQEIFSKDELIQKFSIERIGKSGTKFDINKAKWFNLQYLKTKNGKELSYYLLPYLEERNIVIDPQILEKICALLKERIQFPQDLWNDGKFFFIRPDKYDEKVISKKWTTEVTEVLTEFASIIKKSNTVVGENTKTILQNLVNERKLKMGIIMQSLRITLTGSLTGPDLMSIIEILGADEIACRIQLACDTIPILSN